MAYTTTAEVKTYLDISGAGDDALLSDLIDAAQTWIDKFTHRTFEAAADSTRYFDVSRRNVDGSMLWLDGDLAAITTVTNGDSIEVASDEYTTIPRNVTPFNRLRILSNSGKVWTYTTEWMDAISIVGKWAYSTSAPDDIAQACLELASFLYRRRDHPTFTITSIETGTVVTPTGIPPSIVQTLKPYVRR